MGVKIHKINSYFFTNISSEGGSIGFSGGGASGGGSAGNGMDVSLQTEPAGGQASSMQPFGITINGLTGRAGDSMGANGSGSVGSSSGMSASLQTSEQVNPKQSFGNAIKQRELTLSAPFYNFLKMPKCPPPMTRNI